jgi:hypothetical protein
MDQDQMEQLRAAASLLLNKAQDATVSELASAVEKATGVLRLSSELETSPGRERSERRKEYAALLVPVITIISLAATLLVQSWQFSRSEKDKSDEALDARWEDAVKTISQSSKLPPAAIALYPFLSSPRAVDRERARTTARSTAGKWQ